MSKNGDDLGVQSVVWLWGFFVSSVKYASGAMRRPTDPPGARDAHIGIHETFLAGVLARGSGIDYAVSHIHLACQPFSHKGLLFRAGPVAACVSSRLPLSPVASCFLAGWTQVLGLGHVLPFPTSSLTCASCAVRPYTTAPELSHPELSPSHNACFRGHNDLDRCKVYEAPVYLYPTMIVGRNLG